MIFKGTKQIITDNLLNVSTGKECQQKIIGRSAEPLRTDSIVNTQERFIWTRNSLNRLRISQHIVKEYNSISNI